MKTKTIELGKASITVEKDYHSLDREYDKLTVVEDSTSLATYISRKPVPVNTALTNRNYWICLGRLDTNAVEYITNIKNKLNNLITNDTKLQSYISESLGTLISTVADAISINNTIQSNEQTRTSNETTRQSNETTRQSNETSRVSAESSRAIAETSRASAETTRANNETSRQSAETSRASAETTRVSNETTRQSNETSRETAETARANSETTRSSNEITRQSNETTRQSNETTRQLNENTRQTNEGTPSDTASTTGSRWARFKKAENERTTIFNTAQTNRTTLYNVAEGTPEDEAATDGSRWARFKKAEETRNAIVNEKVETITNLQENVEDLKDTKANKDGYYSKMTVGSAENLVKHNVNSDEYLVRPTGGESNEVANGVAEVIGLEGQSCVWNQLLKQGKLVDMGVPSGLLWATCNIDITQEDGFAASPFQYECTMFSWGNIVGHNTPASGTTFDYNWGGVNKQEPFYEGQPYGDTPGSTLIASFNPDDTYDAARYNLGSLLRTPTSTEFVELLNNCDFVQADGTTVIDNSVADKRVTVNSILGIYLKSKVNGNLIFFSTSGYGSGSSWNSRGAGGYFWSSSFYSPRYAKLLYFYSGGVFPQDYFNRCYGFAIRAVVNPNTIGTGHNNHRYYVDKDIIVDLSLLNHSNIAPSSTDAVVVKRKIAQLVGVKPNYAYNAGTILSAQTLGIKTYGQNLLNPITRQAKLIPYTWEENSNVYTIKNIPSGATITFTPDNTGVGVTVDVSNGSLDITNYGSGILELSAATANTYVCMKYDGTKDDDVVPYEDNTYDFDVRKVYGKVNGEGEYVQCFPNGMRSAGSVHDDLKVDKASVNIGNKMLNDTESWNNANALSTNPLELLYELATPITYTDLIYRDDGIDRPLSDTLMNITVNNWSIEEQLLTPYEDGNPTSIPATINTKYSIDIVETVDTLRKTCYFADDVKANMQALINCVNTNCAETLGGTFSISDPEDDSKVFTFNFTPNTEPDVEPTNEGE